MKTRPPNQPGTPQAGSDSSLTSAQFHILLTLTAGNRHGYGIMQEIERRTEGALDLGPGTLYRSIKQLLDRGLIEEVRVESAQGSDRAGRRRSYALTQLGRGRTAEEAKRLRSLVRWAEDEMVLESGG